MKFAEKWAQNLNVFFFWTWDVVANSTQVLTEQLSGVSKCKLIRLGFCEDIREEKK